jgi:DNA mismatch endonuclease (patch repair protein)
MASVRQKGTTPEIVVRRLLRAVGVRVQSNGRNLPGSPDAFTLNPKRAVFVHGCFWHRHPACRLSTTPKSHTEYWIAKFADNVHRDRRKILALRRLGFRVITIWECEVKSAQHLDRISRRLERFFTEG